MGNLKLVDLLRWKKEVPLVGVNGKPILDKKKPVTVWMRIIGDDAQQAAYRMARIKSAEKREAFRDQKSPDYKDQIYPIIEANREICMELIKASRNSLFMGDALANVVRPDLPKMEDIAEDADGPTLEEQEKMDKATDDIEKEYQDAIQEYIDVKGKELEAELEGQTLDMLRVTAMYETSNALALGVFLSEVQIEKVWRSIFLDEACTIPGYENRDEFSNQHPYIKKQLIDAYENLETSPEELKN